jgi:hypothetical protein
MSERFTVPSCATSHYLSPYCKSAVYDDLRRTTTAVVCSSLRVQAPDLETWYESSIAFLYSVFCMVF